MIFGDLLASGQIRYTPEGHRGQTFTTPGNFLRSICLYHSESPPTGDSWRIVYYKGIPLSLLRDATLSEENALAAIAAQSSMEHWVAEPRGPPPPSGEPSLPKRSPAPINAAGARDVDKGRWPPRKRARERSTPSERGVNLDSRERELNTTPGVIQNARCDCGRAKDKGRMLVCDNCYETVHVGPSCRNCLVPPGIGTNAGNTLTIDKCKPYYFSKDAPTTLPNGRVLSLSSCAATSTEQNNCVQRCQERQQVWISHTSFEQKAFDRTLSQPNGIVPWHGGVVRAGQQEH